MQILTVLWYLNNEPHTYICWYLKRSAGETDGLMFDAASIRWRCVTVMATGQGLLSATERDFGNVRLAQIYINTNI